MVYNARLVCCSLSIIGALFIIVVYFSMKRLRGMFAFRLIMYLATSDLLFSAAMWLGPLDHEESMCMLQAVAISLFGLSTVLWTMAIALTMYLVVLSKCRNVEIHEGLMVLICYGVPIVVSLLPFFSGSYGSSLEWCGLQNNRNGAIWQVIIFYGPLWTAFAVNTYCYWEIRQYLGQVLNELVGITDEERKEKLRVVNRLKWYPWVLLVCWLGGTVDCIHDYIRPEQPVFVLSLLHYTCASLQGVGNALVYGCNSTVTSELKKFCCEQQEPLLINS